MKGLVRCLKRGGKREEGEGVKNILLFIGNYKFGGHVPFGDLLNKIGERKSSFSQKLMGGNMFD